ncbi:M20 family metallopeptidase [Halobellus ordinarius]|uniref:M20 family metallopeptidase n=1 Tax=Halobellus ordinarius TaxID=3075120 RepID=UPI00287FFF9C|nr:M20/M25/M40 family metallo-hydrolase [Halobellus sp. ZY16]
MPGFERSEEDAEGCCPFCFGDQTTETLPEKVDEDSEVLLAFLDEHEADLIELTQDLIGFESQNPPGDTREIIEYIEQYATTLGLRSELVIEDEAKPNLLITLPGKTETTLLYNGHVDTVPYEPDGWTHDPLGEREGDQIYGRGATDMKSAIAAMLHAVRAYVETGVVPPVTLQLAVVSDEETAGDAGLRALLDQDRLTADACVIGETTCEAGSHSVTIADKGSIWLTLEATGKAAHGSRPPLGENAIDRLFEAITELRERLRQVDFALDDEMIPIVEESVSFYTPRMDRETAWRLFTTPTVNVGTFEGGGTVNSVPEAATAELDIRLTAGVHTPSILDQIETLIQDHPAVEIADVSWSIGTYEPFESPLVEATATLAESVANEPVLRRSATGGGDAKTLRNESVPTIEFAFGTDTAHAADEYITVQALQNNARVFTKLPFGFAALTEAVGSSESEDSGSN